MDEDEYEREYATVAQLKLEYSIAVESFVGNSVENTFTVVFSHHRAIREATIFTVTGFTSAKTGEFSLKVEPKFWGTKLPELVPAIMEIIDEYCKRETQ